MTVSPSWRGKTREELVDLPSWIPQDMRDHPRAYLVPARESRTRTDNREYGRPNAGSVFDASFGSGFGMGSGSGSDFGANLASGLGANFGSGFGMAPVSGSGMDFASGPGLKRSFDSALAPQGPPRARYVLPPPPFPRPQPEPGTGQCVSSTWDWQTSEWLMRYEDGTVAKVASQSPDGGRQYQPVGTQHDQSSKRIRFDGQQVQQHRMQQPAPTQLPQRQRQQPAPVQAPAPVEREDNSGDMLVDTPSATSAPSDGFGSMAVEQVNKLAEQDDYKSDSE